MQAALHRCRELVAAQPTKAKVLPTKEQLQHHHQLEQEQPQQLEQKERRPSLALLSLALP